MKRLTVQKMQNARSSIRCIQTNSTKDLNSTLQDIVEQSLRTDLAAAAGVSNFLKAKSVITGRYDLEVINSEEKTRFESLKKAALAHKVRPSLANTTLAVVGFVGGVTSAFLPKTLNKAVSSGVQEAIADICNSQLRDLNGAGSPSTQVKEAIVAFRDGERGEASSTVRVPDISTVGRLSELSSLEMVAGFTKVGTKFALSLTRKL